MVTRAVLLIVGLSHALPGLLILLVPRWFYDNVGTFPPYNPHFLGDAGAFELPVGVALMAAATDPLRHRWLVLLGAAASLLHFANHLLGSLEGGGQWLLTAAVGVPAAALVGVLWIQRRSPPAAV